MIPNDIIQKYLAGDTETALNLLSELQNCSEDEAQTQLVAEVQRRQTAACYSYLVGCASTDSLAKAVLLAHGLEPIIPSTIAK